MEVPPDLDLPGRVIVQMKIANKQKNNNNKKKVKRYLQLVRKSCKKLIMACMTFITNQVIDVGQHRWYLGEARSLDIVWSCSSFMCNRMLSNE